LKIKLRDFSGLSISLFEKAREDSMTWTETTRRQYDRSRLRYASDCRDAERELTAPLLSNANRAGRPLVHKMRDLWNAVQSMSASGCQWPALPKDFPHFSTVQYHFYKRTSSGILAMINEYFVAASRIVDGCKEAPTAAIIDSQSIRTTESGGPRSYDAGKKVKGRKRHIVTDTQGNMPDMQVHKAGIQDRDGAPNLVESARDSFPALKTPLADDAYKGPKPATAIAHIREPAIRIVRKPDPGCGFVLLPQRWIVERTFAWFNRCRRLARDWKASIASSQAWLLITSIRRMNRHVARKY
jgi:transposase